MKILLYQLIFATASLFLPFFRCALEQFQPSVSDELNEKLYKVSNETKIHVALLVYTGGAYMQKSKLARILFGLSKSSRRHSNKSAVHILKTPGEYYPRPIWVSMKHRSFILWFYRALVTRVVPTPSISFERLICEPRNKWQEQQQQQQQQQQQWRLAPGGNWLD
ncbi:unnamed protein product [Trichogramma brassicae]|uniref:Uncharacterized protein n=1 Tax=Trichogramma brassicae TaxID=86971 RepID=A0A6H5IGS7_9HYME|nr:unnamed protein product [Trichogramma brassicae]